MIWLRRELRWKPFLASLALFALLAFPIALCQLRNALGLPATQLFCLTLPQLTEGRQAATSVFGGGGPAAVWENAKTLLAMLWKGGDGLIWNALPFWRGGIMYFFGLPAAALGVVRSLMERKERPGEAPLRFALWSALLCALLIRGNVNRVNMLWLPLIYFAALGLDWLIWRLGRWCAVPLAGMLACFVVFFGAYNATLGGAGNVNYFPGLGEAIRTAEAAGAETVYITNSVNQPYIFALFYTETPPKAFVDTVVYRNPSGAFRQAERFEGFEFRDEGRAEVSVLYAWQAEGREVLARCGSFVVCR